jgi:hypothetical protein
MHGVTALMRAEFFHFKPARRKLFVLRCRLVAALTFRAGQCNNISHGFTLSRQIAQQVMLPLPDASPRVFSPPLFT